MTVTTRRRDFGLRAVAQYASFAGALIPNLILVRVLSPSEYGKFAAAFALSLLIVGLHDQGWNLLLSGKTVPPSRVALGKVVCAMVGVPVALGMLLLGAPTSVAMTSLILLLLLIVPLLSFVDTTLISRDELYRSAGLRLAVAGLLMVVPAIAVMYVPSAVSALSAVVFCYSLGALAGVLLLAWSKYSSPAFVVARERGLWADALKASAYQAPANVVSNGFVAGAGLVGTAAQAGQVRVLILALGLVIAVAPTSPVQLVAQIGQDHGQRLRPEREILVSLFVVAVAGVLFATFAKTFLEIGLGLRYGTLAHMVAALVLSAPLVVLAYYSLALSVSSGRGGRAAVAGVSSAALSLLVGLLLLPTFGIRGIALAVSALAACVLVQTVPRFLITGAAACSGLALVGLTLLVVSP